MTHSLRDYTVSNTLKQWCSCQNKNDARKKMFFSLRLKRPSYLYSTPSISQTLLCIFVLILQVSNTGARNALKRGTLSRSLPPSLKKKKKKQSCHHVITQPQVSQSNHIQRAFFRSSLSAAQLVSMANGNLISNERGQQA